MGFSLSDLNPFSKAITEVVDRLLPDKTANDAAKNELAKMTLSGELAQIAAQTDILKIEAANPNMFIAGPRPAVMWVCCAGLAVQFIINPIFTWVTALIGHSTKFPDLDMGTLTTLLITMLGLSGMRTGEKIANAEGNR